MKWKREVGFDFTRTNFEFGAGWVWLNSMVVGLEIIIGWNLGN